MTRGKYAAKAANRMANLDNELLQQAIEDRNQAREERDAVLLELRALKRDMQGVAMREASRLAESEIRRLNDELREMQIRHIADNEEKFRKIVRTLKRGRLELPEVAEILGYGSMLGEVVADELGGMGAREYRRRTVSGERLLSDGMSQKSGRGGRGVPMVGHLKS